MSKGPRPSYAWSKAADDGQEGLDDVRKERTARRQQNEAFIEAMRRHHKNLEVEIKSSSWDEY